MSKGRGESRELLLDVNAENEQVVLGALTNDPEAFRREVPRLREADFAAPLHRTLLRALKATHAAGATFALDTAIQLADGELPLKWLRELTQQFPALPAENLAVHLGILRRDAVKLSAAENFGLLYDALDDPHGSLDAASGAALSVLRDLREGRGDAHLRGGADLRRAWFSDLSDLATRRAEHFRPLGFSALDAVLYEGLRPGRVVVLAGRPGTGKSTFCSNLTWRQVRRGRRVLSVPVEAGTASVVEQVACCLSRVPAERVVKTPDALTKDELTSLEKAAKVLLDGGLLRLDDEMSSLDELELRVEEGDFDVVILDLFEYLLPGKLDAADVTSALRRLKRLAKRRNFAAVVVQQIRRIKRTKNPRPFLHELKNSGGYEEVADLVLLLHRDKYYDPDSDDEDVLEVCVAKQRRGPQNVTIGFEFDPAVCRVGKNVPVKR